MVTATHAEMPTTWWLADFSEQRAMPAALFPGFVLMFLAQRQE
jgi:hypothetical protein